MKRALLTLLLYVLASPVFVVKWLQERRRLGRVAALLRRGSVRCPFDETPIPLAGMNTCSCGFVSPSALVLVPCEFCGAVPHPPFVQCPTCGATVKVEVS
jgi:hypothetical protein